MLNFKVRSDFGKGAAKKLRKSGFLPAVVLLKEFGSVSVSICSSQMTKLISDYSFKNTVFDAVISPIGDKERKCKIIVSSIDFDPVTSKPMHIDFTEADGDSVIVPVPLKIVGKDVSPGVKRGGKINVVSYSILLNCPIGSVPKFIEIDISKFGIGRSLFASSIALKDGITLSRDCLVLSIIGRGKQDKEDTSDATAAA